MNVIGLTIATRWPNLRGTLSNWHFRSLGLPAPALDSNMAIAQWQIAKIERWCSQSDGKLVVIRSAADLEKCLTVGGPIGIVLGVQGGHALDGDVANVGCLKALGVRLFALAHVMDNAAVGSSTGRSTAGLSDYGREVIGEVEAQSIIVDLAHMSLAGISEALPLLHRPFVLSHTGLTEIAGSMSRFRAYSPGTRNIPASLAREIGRAGGLAGMILATQLLGGSRLSDAVATIRLAVESAGAHHVAIGSDMDGALKTVIDVEGLPALTDALLESGLAQSTVEGVLGRNAINLLRQGLPSS